MSVVKVTTVFTCAKCKAQRERPMNELGEPIGGSPRSHKRNGKKCGPFYATAWRFRSPKTKPLQEVVA